MSQFNNKLIDRKFVHKNDVKNVFIMDIRRIIPIKIEKTLLESVILPSLGESEKKLIIGSYSLFNDEYRLKCLTFDLSSSELNKLNDSVSTPEFDFIKSCYTEVSGGYTLNNIHDEVQNRLISLLGNDPITDLDRGNIYQILEEFEDIPKPEVYYADMVVDMTHDFFFEHENEHVPGMMIIEAFRQFAVASIHKFGYVPTSAYQIILNQMNSDFISYAELSLQITIKGDMRRVVKGKKGHWTDAQMIGTVLQDNVSIADFDACARIIPTSLFKRIRKSNRLAILEANTFCPHPQVEYTSSLYDLEKGKYINVNLEEIGLQGFIVNIKDSDKLVVGKEYSFCFHFDGHSFIQGNCRATELSNSTFYFEYLNFDSENLKNLKNSLIEKCLVV